MNRLATGVLLAGVALAGASPGVRADDKLLVAPALYTNTDISQATLYGNKGNDWAIDAGCSQGGACTLVGTTIGSFGDSTDYLVIRVDAAGKPLWARTYGGSGKDILEGSIVSPDGGTLLMGKSFSHFGDLVSYVNGRTLILKTDADGKPAWAKLMQNQKVADKTVTELRAVAQTPDGGYVVVGDYNIPPAVEGGDWPADVAVLKLAHDGQPMWMHHYHFPHTIYGIQVFAERDGRIRVAGHYNYQSDSRYHPLLLTLSADGAPTQAVEYLYDGDLYPFCLGEQADGKLVMSGEIQDKQKPLENHAATLWINQDGTPQAGRSYSIDGGFSLGRVAYLPDGLAMIGHTGSWTPVVRATNGPVYEGIVLMLDAQGDVKTALDMSTKQRNPRTLGDTDLWGVAPLENHKYFVAGSTDAFGKGDSDVLTTVWTPAAGTTSFVHISPLEVKSQLLALPTVAGDTSAVRDLGVGRLDVETLEVPGGSK